MNTPAHVALNLVILGRRDHPEDTPAVVVGSVLPDLPMMVFYFYEKVLRHVPEALIWSRDYHHPAWQAVFDTFHSLPLLLMALGVCYCLRARQALLVFASMTLHVLEDAPLHHADAHRHLFPLSDWRFHSPLSYWDPAHYGHLIAPLEVLLFASCCLVLAQRVASSRARWVLAVLVVTYAAYWSFVSWMWS